MADQKLLAYIRENQAKGVSLDGIRLSLLESGWPQGEIDAGMAEVSTGREASPPPKKKEEKQETQKKGHKKLIVLLIILAILVFLFLYTAASIVTMFRDMFPGSMDSINNLLGGGS